MRAEDQDRIFQRKIRGRMPIYTYICKKCDHQFDIEQKITAEALKDCPECKAPELKKKLYPVGIALKVQVFIQTITSFKPERNLWFFLFV